MKKFEAPIMNISTFEVEDIIITSNQDLDEEGFDNEVVKP